DRCVRAVVGSPVACSSSDSSVYFLFWGHPAPWHRPPFPTRRSSDLIERESAVARYADRVARLDAAENRLCFGRLDMRDGRRRYRSEEHTSELQSREKLVCRLLLEKKKHKNITGLRSDNTLVTAHQDV